MDIKVSDYEKLGRFYLGREYDPDKGELEEELLLYDSKDLVTHGVVLGMTGSGKTGLCIALLEEAAMDNIPAIVIDPKGDISNILLTFPEFRGEDFRPWINEDDARKKGMTPGRLRGPDRRDVEGRDRAVGPESRSGCGSCGSKVEVTVFTPGSKAGIPVSILSSLEAPPFEVLDDGELLGERIESTVSSLLSLVGVDADPIQSPEAVLLASIFHHCWSAEQSLSLESLDPEHPEAAVRQGGGDRLRVLHEFQGPAGPGLAFQQPPRQSGLRDLAGGPAAGHPAHDVHPGGASRASRSSRSRTSATAERMFFVSLLLNQTLGWMRAQSGTTSLRALLYMDEIFGFLPPSANPAQQEAAHDDAQAGAGLRSWGPCSPRRTRSISTTRHSPTPGRGFSGRLQTERDKMRVLDGLEGSGVAWQGGAFDKAGDGAASLRLWTAGSSS